ncbi:MAG: F0F1 ATP synthase subunit A [Zetaproteobacteria bacterium]|nr:MAG: F0F1 ATP synthase subunit A [Zetaproteobacteria bacterium]
MTVESMQPLRAFEVQVYWPLHVGALDLSISNTAVTLWLAVLLAVAVLLLGIRRPALLPRWPQLLVEQYYIFVRTLTLANIRQGERFVPLIFSLFTFVLASNLIGMLPGMFTATAQLVVTGTLALMVFLYSLWLRFCRHGWRMLGTFLPHGVPGYLVPLLLPVELLSFLARPVSLAVRLFANMTAGHTVMGVIAFFGLLAPWFIQWVPLGLSVALYAIEIFIAVLQAYIFSVLSCVYIDDAL